MSKYVGKFILGLVDILTSLLFGVMPAMFGGMNIYAAIYTHGWTRFGNISVAILLLTLWVIFVYAFGDLEAKRQENKKIVEKITAATHGSVKINDPKAQVIEQLKKELSEYEKENNNVCDRRLKNRRSI